MYNKFKFQRWWSIDLRNM